MPAQAEPVRVLTVRCDPLLHAALKEAAWRARRSLNVFCVEILREQVERVASETREPDGWAVARRGN